MNDSLASCTWSQKGNDIVGENAGDQFGDAVAMSANGRTVSIGAELHDTATSASVGLVQLYRFYIDCTGGVLGRLPEGWLQNGADLEGEARIEFFGSDVALAEDGNTLVIGAVGHNSRQGRVQVYTIDGEFGSFTQLGSDILGEDTFNSFGTSVSVSDDGTIVAAGAYTNDGTAGEDSGHVRVYRFDDKQEDWVQMGSDIEGEAANDWFGLAIGLSSDGRTLAAGSRLNSGSGVREAGHVRVFTFDGTDWRQLGPDIDGTTEEAHLGHSLSLSGNGRIVACGVPRVSNNSGIVSVFEFDADLGDWVKVGNDLSPSVAGGWFGFSTSLAKNGQVVAVGSWVSESGAGSAEVWYFDTGSQDWEQIGQVLSGSASDRLGTDVALSADGSKLIAGAPGDRLAGEQTGYARIFELDERCSALLPVPETPQPTQAPSTVPSVIPSRPPQPRSDLDAAASAPILAGPEDSTAPQATKSAELSESTLIAIILATAFIIVVAMVSSLVYFLKRKRSDAPVTSNDNAPAADAVYLPDIQHPGVPNSGTQIAVAVVENKVPDAIAPRNVDYKDQVRSRANDQRRALNSDKSPLVRRQRKNDVGFATTNQSMVHVDNLSATLPTKGRFGNDPPEG